MFREPPQPPSSSAHTRSEPHLSLAEPAARRHKARVVGIMLMVLAAATSSLAPHLWQHRVVVIHDGGRSEDWMGEQVEALRKAKAENIERDIVVWVCRSRQCVVDAEAGVAAKGALDHHTVGQDLGLQGPSIILLGKDGGVKLRRGSMAEPAELHALIDKMPMRQAEMRLRRFERARRFRQAQEADKASFAK